VTTTHVSDMADYPVFEEIHRSLVAVRVDWDLSDGPLTIEKAALHLMMTGRYTDEQIEAALVYFVKSGSIYRDPYDAVVHIKDFKYPRYDRGSSIYRSLKGLLREIWHW
jgi:hypothetical protein